MRHWLAKWSNDISTGGCLQTLATYQRLWDAPMLSVTNQLPSTQTGAGKLSRSDIHTLACVLCVLWQNSKPFQQEKKNISRRLTQLKCCQVWSSQVKHPSCRRYALKKHYKQHVPHRTVTVNPFSLGRFYLLTQRHWAGFFFLNLLTYSE